MKLLKTSISAFLGSVIVVSGALVVGQPSMADSGSSAVAPATGKVLVVNKAITESEVLAAQKAWGEALVAISMTYETKGIKAAKALAEQVIDEAYGYQFGPVLFKPTLATNPQVFRTTRAGALAYFVGDDPNFPTDQGFALRGWRKVETRNAAMFISGNTATTMDSVIFTDKEGKVTTVEKTLQFLKDDSGKMRIIVHHSSLPYTAK